MKNSEDGKRGRVVIGLFVIVIGILMLANTAIQPFFNLDINFFAWHNIFIMIGLLIFINSSKKTPGVIFIAIGTFGLINSLGFDLSNYIFPAILIGLGLVILMRTRKKERGFYAQNKHENTIDTDKIEDFAIFGGGEKRYNSPSFKGGSITAIFGGSEIDLRESTLAEGDSVLDVLFIFGGGEILVPNSWNIRVDVIPIFGGFSHKRKYHDHPIDTSRTLIIKGLVLFGGGEIKYV